MMTPAAHYAQRQGSRLCRVIEGKLWVFTVPMRSTFYDAGTDWRPVADEDAGLREAWERYRMAWIQGGGDPDSFPLTDSYLIARGPGVVACEECGSTGGLSAGPAPEGPYPRACELCNPSALDRPELVPIGELDEWRCHDDTCPCRDGDACHYLPHGDTGAWQWPDPDLQAILVLRSEECGGCVPLYADGVKRHPEPLNCEACRGTGRVETLEVYSRE